MPSQALGVRMGGSVRTKPWVSKYSGAARMMVARMRRMADWRGVRIQRWRCSMRKSTPCSLGEMGKGAGGSTAEMDVRCRERRARSRRARGRRRGPVP